MKTLAIASLLLMTATSQAAMPTPPDVEKRAHEVRAPHGAVRQDEYYWLRDDTREDKAMLAYLEAENAYVDAVAAPLKPVEDALYDEFEARIKQDDASVPFRDNGWWYYSRYETGKDYPVHARRKDAGDLGAAEIMRLNEAGDFAAEQVLLDVNAMAEGKEYFSVGVYETSPDNRILAWAEDSIGRRQYTIRFRDLETGRDFPKSIPGLSADMAWADDNRTLFYVENDPDTLLTVRA